MGHDIGGRGLKQITKTLLLASLSTFIAFSLIRFPDEAFKASIRGLNMWWEVVFPSLLPFFITSELLLAFGVVKFVGILFEPIMRPLFNVPGVGSFGWVMGMASGYPTGAKIASRLREEKQLTRIEAERLVSFTNASSPLFIIGAVSVGFFHDAKLGVLLAAAHYIGNALVGFCMRFHGLKSSRETKPKTNGNFSLIKAFQEMHHTRLKDPRPIGEVLGDSVVNSIKTLVMVGGFIILFSVLTKLLFLVGITPFLAIFFKVFLQIIGLPIDMALPLFSGLFEITIGAQSISGVSTDSILAKAILISFILGFNGFSVQAQVASILAKTDIRFTPYFFARFLHGIFASIIVIILYKPLYLNKQAFGTDDIPVTQQGQAQLFWLDLLELLKQFGPIFTILSLAIAFIILYRRGKQS